MSTQDTTFVRLSGAAVRFRKEVLRVWSGIDPNTGNALEFTRETLVELARNSNRWLALGHEIPAPNGHTEDAMANLGRWLSFDVEGDALYGVLEPADAEVAAAIGTRIRGVSIYARGPVLASAGVKLGFTILHVCLTPVPVLPNQENFVRLAREMRQEKPMTTPATSTDPTDGMGENEFLLKAEGLLGLTGATWDDVFEALRGLVVGADDTIEDDGAYADTPGPAVASYASMALALEASDAAVEFITGKPVNRSVSLGVQAPLPRAGKGGNFPAPKPSRGRPTSKADGAALIDANRSATPGSAPVEIPANEEDANRYAANDPATVRDRQTDDALGSRKVKSGGRAGTPTWGLDKNGIPTRIDPGATDPESTKARNEADAALAMMGDGWSRDPKTGALTQGKPKSAALSHDDRRVTRR